MNLKKAIERGDGLSALRNGLMLSRDTLGAYAKVLEQQQEAMSALLRGDLVPVEEKVGVDALDKVNSELAVIQGTMKDIGKGLEYLDAVIAIKDGQYVKGAVLLYAAYYEVPWIGWAIAAYDIMKAVFGGDDSPQGDARLVAGGPDGTQIVTVHPAGKLRESRLAQQSAERRQ